MGINVHSSSILSSATSNPSGNLSLTLKDKKGETKEMETDIIVVTIGIQPNVDVVKASGFEVLRDILEKKIEIYNVCIVYR